MKYLNRKYKLVLIITAVAIVTAVSLWRPEYAENVARAFVLLLAGV